ncbi:MAG: DUF4424 family protein [Magnetococcales bacterium]|nr:DUF4424 family protein [Magnetococcales bacterium]
MKKRLLIGGLVALLAVSDAAANDTSFALAAGGMVFEKNDAVRMRSEVLRIAVDQVEVNYVFENISSEEVTLNVAFPLPPTAQTRAYPIYFDYPMPEPNFVNFRLWVDGEPLTPSLDVRVFSKEGADVTKILNDLGVSLFDPFSRSFSKMPLAVREAMKKQGLADHHENDDDWWLEGLITKVTFHWRQRFPVGQKIKVRHLYQPVSGSRPMSAKDGHLEEEKKFWCLDDAFLKVFTRWSRESEAREPMGSGYLRAHDVGYVLQTGANWAGPIEDFTLIVQKSLKRKQLISTCPIPGLKLEKQGDAFVAKAKNFVPRSDLHLLFVDEDER